MSESTGARDKKLHRAWRAGDEAALDELVKHQAGLVYREVGKLRSRFVSNEDRVQLGFEGVVEAAHRYDEKKAAFSTYAILWIRAKILRAIVDASGKLTSKGHRRAFFKLHKAEHALMAAGLDWQDPELVARQIGGVSLVDVTRAQAASVSDASLDSTMVAHGSGETGGTLADVVADEHPTPQEAHALKIGARDRSVALRAAMAQLSDRECFIIRQRWLHEKVPTQGEVGEKMGGLSRERVRQLELRAMNKMRRWLGVFEPSMMLEEEKPYGSRRGRPVITSAVPRPRRDLGRVEGCRRMGCAGKPGRRCSFCLRERA